MKKSVIIAILVIYVLAIVIVGFIGIQMRIYDPVVYIDKIDCVSDGYKEYDASSLEARDGLSGLIAKPYTEGLRVLVKCAYEPADANAFPNGKPFKYSAATKPDEYILVEQDDGTCVVEFLKGGACCDVIVKAQDGSNKQIIIRVFATPDKGKFFD